MNPPWVCVPAIANTTHIYPTFTGKWSIILKAFRCYEDLFLPQNSGDAKKVKSGFLIPVDQSIPSGTERAPGSISDRGLNL